MCDGSHVAYNEENGTNYKPWMASKEKLGKDEIHVCLCGASKKRLENGNILAWLLKCIHCSFTIEL